MVTHDDDDANKRSAGEKRCFDLLAKLLLAYGDDEIRARRGQQVQERNMLMIHTITSAATNAFLFGKRKIEDDDHDQSKNQENTASSSSSSSSSSLVEYKRRRVVSNDEPIRAEPIREIKPPVRERKGPVKRKEPVKREAGETPEWLVELMRKKNGGDAKLVIEKEITKTDLKADQGRLLIPFKQISEMNFLNKTELKILEKRGLDVVLLNSNDAKVQWNANLRIWKMRTSFNYSLCSGWNQFVRDNDLVVNQTRRLWSFHSHDGTLYFVFNPLTQDEAMAQALVPVTHAASSSSMAISDDPFDCEEANRRLLPKFARRSRTPRVCVTPPTSNLYLLEGGFDLNTTPPPEMDPDLESVQDTTPTRSSTSSQESLTETSVVISFTETTTVDLELRL